MRNTERGLQVDPSAHERPYARLTDDDRRLIRRLIVALAAFTLAAVVGIGIVTVDLLARDAERQETVDALLLGEDRRRTNFELLTDYLVCIAVQTRRHGNISQRQLRNDCPDPPFVPPPDAVELVPSEVPDEEVEGSSDTDGPP